MRRLHGSALDPAVWFRSCHRPDLVPCFHVTEGLDKSFRRSQQILIRVEWLRSQPHLAKVVVDACAALHLLKANSAHSAPRIHVMQFLLKNRQCSSGAHICHCSTAS